MDLNALFAQWLQEHHDELAAKGSKLAYAYSKALEKVQLHTDPISSPRQLKGIQYVGDKIFTLLTAKLKAHCAATGVEPPAEFAAYTAEREGGQRLLELDGERTKRRRVARWVPKRRSGSWAILVALYTNDPQRRGLRKEDVVAGATPHCDSSFTANPSARDFYSAWDGIKTLLRRELVACFGRPKVYALSDDGVAMAAVIAHQEGLAPPSNTPDTSMEMPGASKSTFEGVPYDVWEPAQYEVVLVVDNREIRSQNERDFFQNRLSEHVECAVRALAVGDVLWLARHRASGREAVLNYVCERKRLDDLAMSIRDGRFANQKNRLKRLGLRHVHYLIEEGGLGDVQRIADMKKALETAILTVATVSNFYVQRFRRTDDTVDWLVAMTRALAARYRSTSLVVLRPPCVNSQDEYSGMLHRFRGHFEGAHECVHTFSVFQASMVKSNMMTVKEMFILMLMLVRGITFEKAVVLQQHFKTPKLLVDYYKEHAALPEAEKGALLVDLFRHQVGGKKINKAASLAMYETWGSLVEPEKQAFE